jgi:hypothetical protein
LADAPADPKEEPHRFSATTMPTPGSAERTVPRLPPQGPREPLEAAWQAP